jgi:putative ABC transport system permease protein
MIWNKKKQNALLITEMLISFLVLFAVFTALVFAYQNYRKPMGLDYDNVWAVNFSKPLETNNTDTLMSFYEILRQDINSLPEVDGADFSSDNIPFANNTSQTGFLFNKKHINAINWYTTGPSYQNVLKLKLLAGHWFTKEDIGLVNQPLVINESLKQELFGESDAIGKLVGDDDDKHKKKVIGVVQDIKMKGDYAVAGLGAFNNIDSSAYHWLGRMLVRVKPNAGAAFESRLYKRLAGLMKNSSIEIEHLANKRVAINYFALVPIIILLIVAGFLVINVALGLFGVLWYNINKRRGEIGLRRAVGASGGAVTSQLVGEAMVVATFSLIVGTFFAIQFPLLNVFDLPSSTYLTGLGLSIVFIYLLVLICAVYPGRQAAAILPAIALHED